MMALPLCEEGDYGVAYVEETHDGIRSSDRPWDPKALRLSTPKPDLVQALTLRPIAAGHLYVGGGPKVFAELVDHLLTGVLAQPSGERWREAASTALLGNWCAPFLETGALPLTALGALRAETRRLHRQLVPMWRRSTRHGRVLSLDADFGNGLSLHDMVAADVDLLARVTEGVFEDERLNTVLRGLAPEERKVVLARAYGEGTTWTEAAAAAGAADPKAFGERVRRKAHRQVQEQRRRLAQRTTKPGC
ncbi:hypothetical protein [Streptomyces murinus]|uniref:hypothetical protein n=1 Tax=Streptomyces murinus TaxID=33900 RepID=UPI00380CF35F